jgi:hypothetical protein
MYLPSNPEEAYSMLPSATQHEYAITEHSHWTVVHAHNELAQLTMSALRVCRTHAHTGKLVMLDDGHVCVVDKQGTYRLMPSIMRMYTYMSNDDVFELLTHSGIAYLLSIHPSYML